MMYRKEYFRDPILETLAAAYNGSATRPEVLNTPVVLEAAERMMKDYGQRNWKIYCDNMRERLVTEGLLREDSPYGVWELSPLGRRHMGLT